MLLEFIGPSKEATPQYYENARFPFTIGQICDVAEIFESPGYVMARMPGEADWPAPGQPAFELDPGLFEPRAEPIEIVSCGYRREEYLAFAFGVVICEKEALSSVQRAQAALEDIGLVEPGETYDCWRSRCAEGLTDALARYVYEDDTDTRIIGMPEILIYEKVVHPKRLPSSFAAICYTFDHLVRRDVSTREASRLVGRFLEVLAVPGHVPKDLDFTFWTGDGAPRLINPP